MIDDDDDLRAELRAIGQDYDPAGFAAMREAALRRGRRALLARRAGAVVAAVAVIGGVGAGVAALDTVTSGPDRVPAASGLQRGHDGDTRRPGWNLVVLGVERRLECEATTGEPETSSPPAIVAPSTAVESPDATSDAPVPPHQNPDGLVEAAVREVVTGAEVVVVRQAPNRIELSVSAPEGHGSVQVEVGSFEGVPARMADRDFARFDRCGVVQRRETDEGAMLVLHEPPVAGSAYPFERELRLYRPDGTIYVVTVFGNVPTGSQLAHIGEWMATPPRPPGSHEGPVPGGR